MEKAWFHEILFFQVVIAMVKDKKSCIIKDMMPIKTIEQENKSKVSSSL